MLRICLISFTEGILTEFLSRLKHAEKKHLYLRTFFFLSVLIFSLSFFERLFSQLVITPGGSVPYFLFKKESGSALELGDYVLVKSSDSDPVARGRLIVKRISCISGMWVKIAGLDYYCCRTKNSKGWEGCVFLGRAKLYSKNGTPVNPFNPCKGSVCYVFLSDESYFLVNDHPDSYDSRYIGPVKKWEILARLRPLF